MKTCPFCREPVHEDAIKCRYCASSLLPVQPPQIDTATNPTSPAEVTASGQTTYVVDKGLVYFSKFVAAVLAIFTAVGVFLYGTKIEQTAEKAQAAADRVDASEKRAKETATKIDEALKQFTARRTEAEKAIAEGLDSIKALKSKAEQEGQQLHEIVSHSTLATPDASSESNPSSARSPIGASTVVELARRYDFPPEFDGRGQTIGLIELGGGFSDNDLDTYFKSLHLAKPRISTVSVDGARNMASDPYAASAQVMTDIEIVGAAAPGARIVVYFASNTVSGYNTAFLTAIRDDANRPSVILTNWGSPESNWTAVSLSVMNATFQSAAERGVTLVVAAGDDLAAADHTNQRETQVDFPASSPWVLACGGTTFVGNGSDGAREAAWEGTQARAPMPAPIRVSEVFALPEWQRKCASPGTRRRRTGARRSRCSCPCGPWPRLQGLLWRQVRHHRGNRSRCRDVGRTDRTNQSRSRAKGGPLESGSLQLDGSRRRTAACLGCGQEHDRRPGYGRHARLERLYRARFP